MVLWRSKTVITDMLSTFWAQIKGVWVPKPCVYMTAHDQFLSRMGHPNKQLRETNGHVVCVCACRSHAIQIKGEIPISSYVPNPESRPGPWLRLHRHRHLGGDFRRSQGPHLARGFYAESSILMKVPSHHPKQIRQRLAGDVRAVYFLLKSSLAASSFGSV